MRVNEHKFCGLLGYTRSVRVLDLVGSIITIRGSGGNYGNATVSWNYYHHTFVMGNACLKNLQEGTEGIEHLEEESLELQFRSQGIGVHHIRLILEYASSAWDPYLKSDIHRLEQIQ